MSALFDLEDDGEVMAEINMTPLVDVMLVLLIIFIVTIPVLNHAVRLDLPEASSQPQQQKPQRVDLGLDASGQLFWNRAPLSPAEMESRLQELARQQPETELHLHADRQTPYEPIAQLLAAANRHGLNRLAFVSEPRH